MGEGGGIASGWMAGGGGDERKTNHQWGVGGYWMNKGVAVVELFRSGLSCRMCMDSAVRSSSRLE